MDPYPFELLSKAYSALLDHTSDPSLPVQLNYTIAPYANNTFMVTLNDGSNEIVRNDYELIYAFEKGITIEAQLVRDDLLFLHSAALAYHGNGCLLVAPPGHGKSTTTWALLHEGFDYLSDELAPIDLDSFGISPYPHALCLKKDPPAPYSLPEDCIRTTYTIHVPTESLPAPICYESVPLMAVFFVRYDPQRRVSCEPVSKAEAAARLYSNALNLLAHERYGLNATVRIAEYCNAYELITGDLQETCALIRNCLNGSSTGQG